MTARTLIGAEVKVLAMSKQTLATPSTVAFDFGTPNDIYLPTTPGTTGLLYKSAMRLVLVCAATTAGTTSTLTWVIEDADDNAGSIGTPAAAITSGTLAGGTADDYKVFGITPQVNRPWLRVSITHATATDSFVATAMLLGIPAGL